MERANAYCPHCDLMCEHEVENRESMIRKEIETWWKCTKCGGSRNYKHPDPPAERSFQYDCNNCGKVTTYNWSSDWSWDDQKGYDHYECSECHVQQTLPTDAKKRKEYREWQKKGCPPPWWFRPTQFLVLLTIIVLSYLFPWVMFTLYLVSTYGLMAYMLWSGEMSVEGGSLGYVFTFLFAPVLIPFFIAFFALRPPIL